MVKLTLTNQVKHKEKEFKIPESFLKLLLEHKFKKRDMRLKYGKYKILRKDC